VKGIVHLPVRALVLACCLLAAGPDARATDLTGTFHKPDGTPVNGKLIFLLSQPARLADGSAQVVPMVKIFQVAEGQLEPGAFIYGNDVLVPAGTHYIVRLVDNANNLLFEQRWSITGASLDLGTLTPTTVGVVLADPLVKNSATEQSVEGPVTFTSPVTAFSLTLNGDLNPGAAGLYSLGSSATPWRDVFADSIRLRGGPWFDVKVFGATCDGVADDTPAYNAALQAARDAGGGVIVFSGPGTCYLKTAPTFPLTGTLAGNIITEFRTPIRVGQTITVVQRKLHFRGVVGGTNGAFQFTPGTVITGDAAANPVFLFRASNTVLGDGTQERCGSHLKNLTVLPAANNDAVRFVGLTQNQCGESVLDGVRLYATGAGNALFIDSALWIFARGNFVFSASGTGNSIRIENNQVGTGNMFFHDGLLVGRGVYWRDTVTQSINGDISFRDITTESFDTAFFTYDSPTNSTTLENIEINNVEMADNDSPQSLLNILAGNDRVRFVWVRNSSGNKSGEKIVQAGSGRILGLYLWPNTGFNTPADVGQSGAFVLFGAGPTYFGSDASSGGLIGSVRSQGAVGIGYPLSDNIIGAAAKPKLKLQVGGETASGIGNDVTADSVALFESSGSTDVTIASGTSSAGQLLFGRSGASNAGMIRYSHTNNQFTFAASNTTVGSLDTTRMLFNVPVWFRNVGVSFNAQFSAPSLTANRTYTLPDFTGTVGVHATATASLNFPEITAGATAELTITVAGAAVGDACTATPADAPEGGLLWSCYVSAANTVVVRVGNITANAVDPAARSWRATVWKN
jgi:hypothetical protein